MVDKKRFWENKILQWEQARYGVNSDGTPLLERFAKRGSSSLRFRLNLAADTLRPHVQGLALLDVGCGSGLLFKKLGNAGARTMAGIDLSEAAIEKANAAMKDRPGFPPMTFRCGSIAETELPPFDVVAALGLTDWLTDDELDVFLARIKGKRILLSFSEKRPGIQQTIHKLYVHVAYGRRTGAYVPRRFTEAEIRGMLRRHGFQNIQIVRDKRLSFGILVHNLDAASASVTDHEPSEHLEYLANE